MDIMVDEEWALLTSYDDGGYRKRHLWKLPYTIEDEEVAPDWEGLIEVKVEYVPKMAGFSVFERDGKRYWLSLTASSFKDREEEIISNRSIDLGIADADERGEYGRLNIYHVRGTEVGTCLAMMRAGNFVLEVGDWDDTSMADKAYQWAKDNPDIVGMSTEFWYQKKDRVRRFGDVSVYTGPIKFQDRAMLKREHAACPWTDLTTVQLEDKMSRKGDIAEIIGDELTEEAIMAANKRTLELVESGEMFAEKETSEDLEESTKETVGEATEKTAEEMVEETTEESSETEEVKGIESAEIFLSDEALEAIADEVEKQVAPVLAAVDAWAEDLGATIEKLVDGIGGLTEEVVALNKSDIEKQKELLTERPRIAIRKAANSDSIQTVEEKDAEEHEEVDVTRMTLPESAAFAREQRGW